MAVTVLGLLWLLGLFLADYFQLQLPPPPTVEGFPLPVPTLMVVAGVVLALFLALTGAVLASLASRARASRVRRRLLRSVREAAAEAVEAPVRAELDAHQEFREALTRAATAV